MAEVLHGRPVFFLTGGAETPASLCQTLTAAGQEYTVIQFTYQDESNPYATGVAAFAQRGTSAIEWELSCQDSYSGDALKVLTDFLNSCTY